MMFALRTLLVLALLAAGPQAAAPDATALSAWATPPPVVTMPAVPPRPTVVPFACGDISDNANTEITVDAARPGVSLTGCQFIGVKLTFRVAGAAAVPHAAIVVTDVNATQHSSLNILAALSVGATGELGVVSVDAHRLRYTMAGGFVAGVLAYAARGARVNASDVHVSFPNKYGQGGRAVAGLDLRVVGAGGVAITASNVHVTTDTSKGLQVQYAAVASIVTQGSLRDEPVTGFDAAGPVSIVATDVSLNCNVDNGLAAVAAIVCAAASSSNSAASNDVCQLAFNASVHVAVVRVNAAHLHAPHPTAVGSIVAAVRNSVGVPNPAYMSSVVMRNGAAGPNSARHRHHYRGCAWLVDRPRR